MGVDGPTKWKRVGLWFGSLLAGVTLFTLWMIVPALFMNGGRIGPFSLEGPIIVFRFTMLYAFPVWCLCLPFVIKVRAAGWRIPVFLFGGTLIGPLGLILMGFIMQLMRGTDHNVLWDTDPLVGGATGFLFYATIVGFLTTSVYLIALKIANRSSSATAT